MQVLRIRSKFWGKSMEFQPEGEVGAKYFIYKIFRTTQILSPSHFHDKMVKTLDICGILWDTAKNLKQDKFEETSFWE